MTNQDNENRFFNMLKAAPEIAQYWDVPERMPKIRTIRIAVESESKGESQCALLRFFGSVWFGNSDMFDFDFIKAMKVMDERSIKIVRKWMLDPFFCEGWAK